MLWYKKFNIMFKISHFLFDKTSSKLILSSHQKPNK